jgi:glycosyltransferase involved in cell wall biosynthesis
MILGADNMALRIGIDFHVAGGIYQGVKTYLANLIHAVLKLENELTYFVYTRNPAELNHWKNSHENLTPKRLPSGFGRFNLLMGFPACALRDRLALFHSQYVLPAYLPCKSVLTIHDILFESHPEFFPKFHRWLMKFFVPYSAKRANRIICVSEFTKQEISRYYGVPDKKVIVTYEGASSMFAPIRDKDLILSKMRQYGIGTKYVLFVGRIEPRKNIVGILKAFGHLKKKGHKRLSLVIVGHQDKIFRERTLFSEIKAHGLQSDVVFTGGVSEQDLCILYSGAEVLVYPAFAEGFGLPVLEAMACGTPVITSNVTSLPEVAGNAAILINPYSPAEIAGSLERVLSDEGLRNELSAKGLERAKKFSWEGTAEKTIEVYRKVLQE